MLDERFVFEWFDTENLKQTHKSVSNSEFVGSFKVSRLQFTVFASHSVRFRALRFVLFVCLFVMLFLFRGTSFIETKKVEYRALKP